ncbi:MAG: glycosyl hydrolase family 28-related protein [Oscillospiraceae bacterium]
MKKFKQLFVMLICFVLVFSAAGCKNNETASGGKNPNGLPTYEKILGGKIRLASDNKQTAQKDQLNYVEDTELSFDNTPQNPTGNDKIIGYPKVNTSGYETDEVFIYNHNVLDFGAKANGTDNDTGAIQSALNRAKITGGTVYIPAGIYRIDGSLTIPHGVTLRGDFCSPDNDIAPGNGTILHIYGGKDDLKSEAAIVLGVGSAVVGMTFYYPEQDYENVVKYPHTVTIAHKDNAYEGDCSTIQDVWFVNSYSIADLGLGKNNGIHYVKNVYGSPLFRGFEMDNCYDVGRVEKIFFSPSYLLKAQEKGIISELTAPQYEAARKQMYENCIGMVINKSDWEYTYDYNVDGLNTAILMTMRKSGASNCQFSHMTIINCKFGMKFEHVNTIGMSIANSYFMCSSDPESVVVYTNNSVRTGINKFNNCTFVSDYSKAVLIQNLMEFSFVNCSFQIGENAVGFESNSSCNIQIQQCGFTGKGVPINLSEKVKRVQILGCTFEDKDKIAIKKDNPLSVTVNHEPLNLPVQTGFAHTYKKTPPRPATNHVYYLMSYGAKVNQDCTEALRKALEDAGKTGGTVYVPTGQYILTGSITVPTGVELRGSLDNQFHPKNFIGTTFIADVPSGESSGALIKLSENSGVAGFSVYYKQQFVDKKVVPFDWTVQSLGKGVWAKNICLMNSYKGIDFATNPSDNYYLHFISGAPIEVGVYVGNNNANGWMENCQFNGHYNTKSQSYKDTGCPDEYHLEKRLEYATSFLFGYNKSAHILGNFSYGTKLGASFISQPQGKLNGIVIGLGIDNSEFSVNIDDVDYVELINSQFTIIKQTNDMKYVKINSGNTGTAKFFNAELYGHTLDQSTSVMYIDGKGQVDIQGFFIMTGSDHLYDLKGGNITISANVFDNTKLVARCYPSVTKVTIIGNVYNPPANIQPAPGTEYLSIDNQAGDKLSVLYSGLR